MVFTRANVESLKGVSHFDVFEFSWNQNHILFRIWIVFFYMTLNQNAKYVIIWLI